MAILKGPIQFDGSLGDVRSYYDKDAKKQVLSTKGGCNKNQLENNESLVNVVHTNREFSACSMMAKLIRKGTFDLVYLKNGRIQGKLISIVKSIQNMLNEDPWGFRKIAISRFNYPLIGFCMNNAHPFKTVFHVEPELTVTENRQVVTLRLSNFISSERFKWPERVMYYRIFLNIFEMPDIEWLKGWDQYYPVYQPATLGNKTMVSNWLSISTEPIDFQLTADFGENHIPREKTVVLVSMGLEFASGMQFNTPFVVKDHGTMAIVGCF